MWKKRMVELWGDGCMILRHKCMRTLLYSLTSFACLVCLSVFKLKEMHLGMPAALKPECLRNVNCQI